MKLRGFELHLLVAALIGGVFAWQTGRERRSLEQTYRRLAAATGELPIEDPSKVYVRALDTGEPLYFAWRVYFPPNYKHSLRHSFGGGSSGSSGRATEFIARVRIRPDDPAGFQVYTSFAGSGGQFGVGDPALASLLRGRWDRIRVEQLGSAGVTALRPDQAAFLLRLTIPDDLRKEASKTLDPHLQKRYVPSLFEVELEPETTKP